MSRKLQKNKWISMPDEPDIQFLIKPFSVLHLKTIPTDEKITTEIMWDVFRSVIVDWKGFEDEQEKPLNCNDENKRKVAEQFSDILNFVFEKSIKSNKEKVSEKEVKN